MKLVLMQDLIKKKLVELHKVVIIIFQLAAIVRHAQEEDVGVNTDIQPGTIILKGLSAKISICESRVIYYYFLILIIIIIMGKHQCSR